MLAFRLMAGSPNQRASRFWVLPGGVVYQFGEDGRIYRQNTEGWPDHSNSGDPFRVDRTHVRFSYQVNLGSGTGGIQQQNALFDEDPSKPADVRGLGGYHGWSGVSVHVSIDQLNLNQFGYTRPNFLLGGAQASHDTGPTADWNWTQQTNQTPPENGLGTFKATLQRDYISGMSYPWGACSTAHLTAVLQPATEQADDPEFDERGRPYLGWTMDGTGTVRRIRDLTEEQIRKLGHDNGFRPPDKDTLTSADMGWTWTFLRPIGPINDTTIAATGCIAFTETYTRVPEDEERGYYTLGAAGYESGNKPYPLFGTVNWYIYEGDENGLDPDGQTVRRVQPVSIAEVRNVFIFVKVAIGPAGIQELVVTGQSVSRSTKVTLETSGFFNVINAPTARRVGTGEWDVFWGYKAGGNNSYFSHPQFSYDGATFNTRFHTSPKGWRMPIEVPQWNRVDDPRWMPIIVYANDPFGGAQPPAKPVDWNDATDGPWVAPPNDIDYSRFSRGLAYMAPDGSTTYQQANNLIYYNSGDLAYVSSGNPIYPEGPYTRDGAGQWYGRGTFVLARHNLSGRVVETTKPAGGIVPASNGPGGSYNAYCAPDATRPAMQAFQWPGRAVTLARYQDGSWRVAYDGATFIPAEDLGQLMGSISIGHDFVQPKPPTA